MTIESGTGGAINDPAQQRRLALIDLDPTL